MLRFGLIGCGTHARWAVLPALASTNCCRLVAAADLVRKHLAAIEQDSVARYADFRRMLAQEQLDAVYVATPVEVHCEATVAALRAGCHVLCEKPMAATVRECRRMIAAAESARKLLAIDFESRQMASHQRVRQWIAEGRIGAVRAVHIDELWDGHKSFGPLAKRRKGFLQRTGCLDCGIHMLDLTRFYCGGGEWRQVRALGAWFGERVKYPPHVSILAELSGGTIVTLNVSFAYTAHIKERHQAYQCQIVGEKGVIALERNERGEPAFQLVSDSLKASAPLHERGHADLIPRVLEDFHAVAVGGKAVPPTLATGHDGLMAQVAVDRANRRAVALGDVVSH